MLVIFSFLPDREKMKMYKNIFRVDIVINTSVYCEIEKLCGRVEFFLHNFEFS